MKIMTLTEKVMTVLFATSMVIIGIVAFPAFAVVALKQTIDDKMKKAKAS